ncbi:unnamed protein product [Choristocarpus tenellus]
MSLAPSLRLLLAETMVLLTLLLSGLAFSPAFRPSTFSMSQPQTHLAGWGCHGISRFKSLQQLQMRKGQLIIREAEFASREPLILTEENVVAVIEEAKKELGTMFGNSAENRGVGITGEVEFVELDGPCVIIRMSGRFWHAREAVLARVSNFILTRIPECIDVSVEDPSQLLEEK